VACCLLTVLSVAALAAVGADWARADRSPTAAVDAWQTRANVKLVARFYAAVRNGNRAPAAAAFVAAGHTYHDPTAPATPRGPAGVAQAVGEWRRDCPDLVLALDDVVGQGDRVVVRLTARGTHRGTWRGAAGTARAVAVSGIAVHRVGGGRIAETWVSWDAFGLALQVGLAVMPVAALGGAQGADAAAPPIQRGRPS